MAIFNSKLFVYQDKMEVIPPLSPSNFHLGGFDSLAAPQAGLSADAGLCTM